MRQDSRVSSIEANVESEIEPRCFATDLHFSQHPRTPDVIIGDFFDLHVSASMATWLV